MRVTDKVELKGRNLFDYLIENKSEIIRLKKSLPIKSEPYSVDAELPFFKEGFTVKESTNESEDPNSLTVIVVANMSMFMDSHLDVLGADCWKKTIKENGVKGKNIIAHIHDHKHTIEAKVGKVRDIRSEDIILKSIGVKSDIKEAQALVFETDIKRDYNNKVFNLYKTNEVNQHSIGMQYVKIELAVNDDGDDYKSEFKVWKKYIDQIINKTQAEDRGYFWYVSEIKLYENSAVLFGSNELTPTLEVIKNEPSNDTQKDKGEEPSNDTLTKARKRLLSY